MTIMFRAAAAAGATGTEVTVNKPAGVAAGDLIVVLLNCGVGAAVLTAPAGFALAKSQSPPNAALQLWTKVATASEPASYTWSGLGSSDAAIAALAYYDSGGGLLAIASGDAFQSGTSTTATAPGLTSVPAGGVVLAVHSGMATGGVALTTPPSTTLRAAFENGSYDYAVQVADFVQASSGSTAARSASVTYGGTFYGWGGWQVAIVGNQPPNAPSITAPAPGSTIDRNSAQRFDWDFSDPDPGDSQSKYDLRYRLVGAATWTDLTETTPSTFRDFASAAFAAGDYEWQVRTYDAQGVVGPYSPSSFFTAATAPETPTITAPINGATVSNTATVMWSTPDQDAYQVRRVADNAGTPNAGTVYYDSGEVVSTAIRSHGLTFATNNRYEHIQVRQKRDGLWSQWASVRVLVSFTPPTTPVVTLTPDAATGSLLVGITNPAPGAGVPATSYNDVYVDDGDGEERKAAMLAPNTAYTYRTPISGRDYDGSVRVVAVGDNGTTSSSTP